MIVSEDDPTFVAPEEAHWVAANTPVIGLVLGDQARAYPVHLVERHQVVNDRVGDKAIAILFDPLSGSPLAFEREVEGEVLEFGVSGLVHNASFVFYDRETESLWSPLRGEAIAGKRVGQKLERIRVRQETASSWHERYPQTVVMERPAPRSIDYRYSPYSSYWVEDKIPFPVVARDDRYHAKEVVVGIVVNGKARAYLGSKLTAAGGKMVDRFEGQEIRIEYDTEHAVFRWEIPKSVLVVESYWFAWKAFQPETDIWSQAPEAP